MITILGLTVNIIEETYKPILQTQASPLGHCIRYPYDVYVDHKTLSLYKPISKLMYIYHHS